MATYYVNDDGDNSTVVNTSTGEVVFTGTYESALNQAEELNNQEETFNPPTTETTKTETDSQSNDENEDAGTTVAGGNNKQKTPNQKQTINSRSGPGKRTWNPLGDFSSYTYRISLYAVTADTFNQYKETGQWDRNQLALLVQSGGSSTNSELDASRGHGFELDYYIDDLELTSVISSKETNGATNTAYYKCKIIEPYGLTFPTKLVDLQKSFQSKSSIPKPVSSIPEASNGIMLLSIRFYGYDENGQIVSASKYNNGSFTKNIDETASFERSFVVFIKRLDFKLEGKGATYNLELVMFDQQTGMGAKRGEITSTITGTGATVGEIIGGIDGVTNGIIDQLNKQQEELMGTKVEIPDVYKIVYGNDVIKNSKIIDAEINKNRVPMATVKSPSGSNAKTQTDPTSATVTPNKQIQFGNGVKILQMIDQVITQSSYVSDALEILENEDAQPPQEGENTYQQNSNPKTLQWFIVTSSVKILGYDHIRKDYACEITYVIQSYDVPYVRSTNIKYVPRYPGPHKIYNYYYTGKNSEVIHYEQNLNNTFFLYSSMKNTALASDQDSAPSQPKPSNNADPIGKPSGTSEGAASIKTYLYQPKDQLEAKIRILGDPDFLMPATTGTIGQMLTKWYGPDFTINPNSGQVFIEVIFNQVQDYSNSSGLLIPNGNVYTNNFGSTGKALSQIVKGTVFWVTKVTSHFSRGKFTQDFTVAIPNFHELNSNKQTSDSSNQRETPDTQNSNDRKSNTTVDTSMAPTVSNALEKQNNTWNQIPVESPNDDANNLFVTNGSTNLYDTNRWGGR